MGRSVPDVSLKLISFPQILIAADLEAMRSLQPSNFVSSYGASLVLGIESLTAKASPASGAQFQVLSDL